MHLRRAVCVHGTAAEQETLEDNTLDKAVIGSRASFYTPQVCISMDKSKLALLLARRQKRLEYWKQQFSHARLGSEEKNAFDATCQLYTRLMIKAARATEEAEKKECEERFEQLEREFNRQFEDLRLLTSDSGTGAIIDN